MVMHVELQATCSALGYQEDGKYVKEPDCLETVKDLIRFLKREDDSCDIRRQLGSAQILQNDLLPLLKTYKDDATLFDTVIRLLVNLTQPGMLCFNGAIPEDKTTRNQYLEIEQHLQSYKLAFADEALFAVLTKKLGDLLQLDWENRQEEDRILIERLLILVRNILHVPPDPMQEKRTDDDASIHDQLLWSLHVSGMEDLLLYIASSDDERQFSMHVLEIISLMFREQTPEQLASAGSAKTDSERQKEDEELDLIREKEKAQKLACVMKYSSRHSRFGGTYVMKNVKSISENQMIYHRSLAEVKNLSFDQDKKPKKKPKNRQPIKSQELTRRSTLSIRLFLKEFCIQLLENCYNPLMYAVKDSLLHSKAQENDESYYLWAMRFFMQFNRLYKFRVELVSETMSVPTFHYIQTNLMTYHETVLSDKKEAVTWSKRMHLALRAYQELLMSLNTMDKDPELKASAKVLKGNVFYMMEYRDIFLILLKKFDQSCQSRTFLKDLIETTHCFTKMLEHFCKKNKHLVVQKKKKGGKKKKSKVSKQKQPQGSVEPEFTQEQLENQWDGISGDLSAIFQDRGDVPENVTPFDAASEETDDQQRTSSSGNEAIQVNSLYSGGVLALSKYWRINAMVKIHEFLRGGKAGEAVAMFRAAREVWPDRQEFGTPDISPEDEFMALREIFFTDIPKPAAAEATQEEELQEEDDQEEIEEEEGVSAFENYEQEFSFREFIDRFGNPQVLKHYSLLLSEYSKNSTFTNHCIVKLLHRVAVDTGKVGMLFQASLFRTFQKILFDPMAKSKHYEEIVTFSKYVVRKFFECAQKNEKMFVELLFWKTNKDAMEVVEGYGTYKEKHSKSAPAWTEEQDEELKYLFDKFRDDTEKDVVDLIMENLTDTTKTRRQVLRELCHLELINSAKDLKKPSSRGAARVWREEQEYELRELFDRFKGSEDPVGNILNNMEVKRSKAKVIEKLLSMGLVEDRKELYKKRKRKSKKGGAEDEDDRFIEEEDVVVQRASSDEEEEEEEEPVLSSSSSDSEASADADEEAEDDKDDDGGDDNHDKTLHKMVKKLFKKGLAGPVKWVQQRLRSVAEDREKENEYEPIPLVPLSEENEDAMDNSLFRCFLKKAGILPPSNEQERFWRISANESPAKLRSIADKLEETYKPPKKKTLSPSAGLSKEKSARFEMLKNMTKNKIRDVKAKEKGERIKRRTEQTHPSPSTPGTTPTGSSKQKSSRLKLINDESSDDDNDDDLTPVSTHQTPLKDDTPSKSGHRLLDSDSSDDDDQPLAQAGQLKSSKDKLTASEVSHLVNSDSSEDEPVTGKRKSTNNGKQDFESDTDDDEPLAASMQKAKKASLALDSDSDKPLSKPSGPKSKLSEETRAQLKRALESDSSDDSDDDRLVIDSEKEKTKQPSKRTKIQEESDLEKKEDKENMRDTSAKELASFPATLLSQGPGSDSDSDIEDHIPLRRGAKRKTIESDSDDD